MPTKQHLDPLLTPAQLAEVIGVTEEHTRVLARRGVFKATLQNGTPIGFPLRASVLAYCEHLRAATRGRPTGEAAGELTEHKARLTAAKADEAEMQNARTRRELVPLSQVERQWAAVMVAIRARLLAVPGRVSARMGYLSPTDVAGIDREIRDALLELGAGLEPGHEPVEKFPEGL